MLDEKIVKCVLDPMYSVRRNSDGTTTKFQLAQSVLNVNDIHMGTVQHESGFIHLCERVSPAMKAEISAKVGELLGAKVNSVGMPPDTSRLDDDEYDD